jgi:hypothetical protein
MIGAESIERRPMGTNHLSSVRRAKKKHEKELKRKRAPSRRRRDSAFVPAASPSASSLRAWHPPAPPPAIEMSWSPSADGIMAFVDRGPFHNYFQAAHTVERFNWPVCPHPTLRHSIWTPSRVAAYPTPDLIEELARLGLSVDREAFLAATPLYSSAVDLARALWVPVLSGSADALERDFVMLAACELWKRWCPDSPSQEMLLEPLLDGYDVFNDAQDVAALEHWITFWARISPHLAPEARTTKDMDALVGDLVEPLATWPSVFAEAAIEATSRDSELGPRAARVLEEILARFTEESPEWRAEIEEDLAVLREMVDRPEGAGGTFRQELSVPDRLG